MQRDWKMIVSHAPEARAEYLQATAMFCTILFTNATEYLSEMETKSAHCHYDCFGMIM